MKNALHIDSPHSISLDQVWSSLHTSQEGLSLAEVEKRQKLYGSNSLPEEKKHQFLKLLVSQFTNLMVLLMTVAAILSLSFGHVFDAVLIFSLVLINALMGFIQEFRAEKSIQALKNVLVPKVTSKREGKIQEIPHEDLVPGDIILLSEGNKIPADARIFLSHNCLISESSLTGESLPVEKNEKLLDSNTALADRTNMVWMGTTVMQGTVEAVVIETGIHTQFGQIASNLQSISAEKEHFSQKVSILSKQMGTIAITSAILTFCIGFFLRNFSFIDISVYTIATLVSALPEGLPIILVIVLAVGAQRMAKKHAIVRKLSATETLGVVSVIITDKTGTLTQNTMSAHKIYLPGQESIDVDTYLSKSDTNVSVKTTEALLSENHHLYKLISIVGVCHQVKIPDQNEIRFETLLGDPTEKALYILAHQTGFQSLPSEKKPTLLDDIPFQQHLRLRACIVQTGVEKEIFLMGAPESILHRSNFVLSGKKRLPRTKDVEQEISAQIDTFSSQGLRIVAVAAIPTSAKGSSLSLDHLDTKDATFIGLVALYDPPRPEVKDALLKAKQAGIQVIMATGDHPQTALAIAKEIGLISPTSTFSKAYSQQDIENKPDEEIIQMLRALPVLARLTPQTKLRLAQLFQKKGHVVAMTGDGVNDAPALKQADVGIAMGITGTDVAREASKIVLTDDNFASIIAAIKEGRTQFNNLRRASIFLVMTNIAESVALLLALAFGYPLPLLPIQILWLNVITGGLTDFSLSLEPTHEDSMNIPPRSPKENILNFSVLPLVGIITLLTSFLCLWVFDMFLSESLEKARTAVFVVLSCSQVLNMLNLRSLKKSIFRMNFFSNPAVAVVSTLTILLLCLAIWFAPLRNALQFEVLTIREFVFLTIVSTSIFITAEVIKMTGILRSPSVKHIHLAKE